MGRRPRPLTTGSFPIARTCTPSDASPASPSSCSTSSTSSSTPTAIAIPNSASSTAVVPDQLKSGVVVPCRYEPGLQRTYEEFARYAGTVVLPARPRKPRDKAKVEAGVLVVTRWILARLRHERFFSLAALNTRIAELLEVLNTRPMRLYRASRLELFERLDRPALRPLPTEAFIVGEWQYDA